MVGEVESAIFSSAEETSKNDKIKRKKKVKKVRFVSQFCAVWCRWLRRLVVKISALH